MIDAGPALEIACDRDPAVADDRLGDGRADAAGGARDEDDLVAQSAHCSSVMPATAGIQHDQS